MERYPEALCEGSRMVDWISDSDDSDKLEWGSEGDGEAAASFDAPGAGSSAPASRNIDAPGPSTQVANGKAGSSASLVEQFVDMSFPRDMVLKAMKENGDGGAESLLELLLTYKAIGDDPSVDNGSASGCVPRTVDDSDDDDILENWDDEDAGGGSKRGPNSDDSGDEVFSCTPPVTVMHLLVLQSTILMHYTCFMLT